MESNTGQVLNLVSLYDRFQGVQDKRKPKGKRYALATILMAYGAKTSSKLIYSEIGGNIRLSGSSNSNGNKIRSQ